MKILKIKVSGFKGLKKNFTIDFMSKTRVYEYEKGDEVLELSDGIYIPTTTVFTGKNSSGKSTALELVKFSYGLLNLGRVKHDRYIFSDSLIDLELLFLLDNILYMYKVKISKPNDDVFNTRDFCKLKDQELFKREVKKSYGKKNLEKDFEEEHKYTSDTNDTSILYNLTRKKNYTVYINNYLSLDTLDFSTFSIEFIFRYLNEINPSDSFRKNIIQLFDSNLKDIIENKDTKHYDVIMCDGKEVSMSSECLSKFLSDGTKKGILLFVIASRVLKNGGTLIIDEIENSFHKALVENIVFLFSDSRINRKHANFIFSTHYVEILDIFKRQDNIFIMKNKNSIYCENMIDDYGERASLVKSKLFNSNTFGTILNYELMMKLKRGLINEISSDAGRK